MSQETVTIPKKRWEKIKKTLQSAKESQSGYMESYEKTLKNHISIMKGNIEIALSMMDDDYRENIEF